MHEMGIADSILQAVRTELRLHRNSRVTTVGVRIGEMAAVDEGALQFCFEALARDTDLDGLKLNIEMCLRRHRCGACRIDFTVRDYDFQCPTCRQICTECVSGDELELAYVEVEEDEPAAAATKSSQ